VVFLNASSGKMRILLMIIAFLSGKVAIPVRKEQIIGNSCSIRELFRRFQIFSGRSSGNGTMQCALLIVLYCDIPELNLNRNVPPGKFIQPSTP
jgi:hypothetical protein